MRTFLIAMTILSFFHFSYSQDKPHWLQQGLELYLTHYFSNEEIEHFKQTAKTLPTIEELENVTTDENEHPAELNDPMASYLLVQFIDAQWGREKLLSLLDNYADFETILRSSKKNIEKYWTYETLFKTFAFKSGNPELISLMNDLFTTFKESLTVPHKRRIIPELEEIVSSFKAYETKIIESDNHLLVIIQNNAAIAGWALFSIESESRVILDILCIHPEYHQYDISRKLITAIHHHFHTIKSITTVGKHTNLRTPYFCGAFDFKK